MSDLPQSYNDWVRAVEQNDPGVVAQMVLDEIAGENYLEADFGYDDSECEAKFSEIGEGLPDPAYFPLWGMLRFVDECMGPGEDARILYEAELFGPAREPVIRRLRPLAMESHWYDPEPSERVLAREVEVLLDG